MNKAESKKRFVLALKASSFNISAACRASAVGRSTYYDWTRADEKFATVCTDLKEAAVDRLESALLERATDGWDEAVFQGGEHVGDVHKFDNRLGLRMLERFRPTHRLSKIVLPNISTVGGCSEAAAALLKAAAIGGISGQDLIAFSTLVRDSRAGLMDSDITVQLEELRELVIEKGGYVRTE